MTDPDRLLAAIIADPDNDTARLAFADLLEERASDGATEEWQAALDRADFLRLQIRLAEIMATDPEPLSLQKSGCTLVTGTPWGEMGYYLDLSYCGVGAAAVTARLESQYLGRIRYLVLRGNDAAWQRQGELRERFGERVTP